MVVSVGRAEVDAKRSELLSLKQTVNVIYAEYKSQAEIRMSKQKEMANLVQLVQTQTNNNNNNPPDNPLSSTSKTAASVASSSTALVEDVILASLWAETRALKAKQPIPLPPKMKEEDPQPTVGTMTKSAEEAMAVYTRQIQLLTEDRIYRQVLLDNEIAMADEFEQGLVQIESIVRDYCENPTLRNMVFTTVNRALSKE